jgi:hypothetical protein
MQVTEFVARRRRLQEAIKLIEEDRKDMVRYGDEGRTYAAYAATWAAVLMACDIIKTGWSAADKKAAAGFGLIDGAVAKANQILAKLKLRTIATKDDALKGLNADLAKPAALLHDIRNAKAWLAKAKIEAPPNLGVVIDMCIGMAEDTFLMLQAGQTQQQVGLVNAAALASVDRRLRKLHDDLRRLDDRIGELLREYERRQYIA